MRQSPLRTAWIVCAVLVAVTLLVYGRGLRNGFVYDDYWLVESNPALRAPGPLLHFLGSGLFAGSRPPDDGVWAASSLQYWRPFIKLALLVQFRAFGNNAGGYHAISLAVHVATVLLLFFWLRARLGPGRNGLGPARGGSFGPARDGSFGAARGGEFGAALGAALFALHPARVESVSWVSGCTDLWMTFWVVLGLCCWQRGTAWARRAALPAFALAVLAKETALVVPACLIIDAWANGDGWRAAVRRTLGPVIAVATSVALWMFVLRPAGAGMFGGVPRILTSAGLYVQRVFWPLHPSTQIGLVGADGRFDFGAALLALGAVALLAVIAAAALALRRPALRPWFADACWAWIPLAPVANLVAVGYSTLIAERFLALPMVGVASLAARSLRAWWNARPAQFVPSVAAGAGVCVLLGAVSAAYVPQLHGNDTLWRYEVRLQPKNPNLRLYLARAEAAAGRMDTSAQAASEAYRLAQTPDLRTWSALAWASALLRMSGDADQDRLVALRNFYDELATRGAATLDTGSTALRGAATLDAGGTALRGAATLDAGSTAMRAAPTSVVQGMVQNNRSVRAARGMTHARTGSVVIAEGLFRDLAREEPNAANAANFARVVALQGRWDDALRTLESARRAYPNDPGLTRLADSVQRARAWARMNVVPAAHPTRGTGAAAVPGIAGTPGTSSDGVPGADDSVLDATARARLWLEVGSLSQARALWSEAVAQAPGRADVVAVGALLDALQGHAEQATASLQSARTHDAANATLYDATLAEVRQIGPQPPAAQSTVNSLFR